MTKKRQLYIFFEMNQAILSNRKNINMSTVSFKMLYLTRWDNSLFYPFLSYYYLFTGRVKPHKTKAACKKLICCLRFMLFATPQYRCMQEEHKPGCTALSFIYTFIASLYLSNIESSRFILHPEE